jgi:hypothetical protein
MPSKGTPRQAIRIHPDLWAEYELACADEGTTRADDVRAHIEKKVRAWKRRIAKREPAGE